MLTTSLLNIAYAKNSWLGVDAKKIVKARWGKFIAQAKIKAKKRGIVKYWYLIGAQCAKEEKEGRMLRDQAADRRFDNPADVMDPELGTAFFDAKDLYRAKCEENHNLKLQHVVAGDAILQAMHTA